MGTFSFSLSDIKKQLGPGLGVRSNAYLLEVAVVGAVSKKLAVLCQSTALPERNIGTADIFYKGRKYKMRGETDLSGTYTINITDDSEMKLRRMFDSWMREVDNTTPKGSNALAGLFGGAMGDLMEVANGTLKAVNEIKSAWEFDGGVSWLKNMIMGKPLPANYQTTVNIWQLTKVKEKLYGYALTNAFPIEVGAVEVSDENENQLSMFSVTFAYSDFEPIEDKGIIGQIVDTVIGQEGQEIVQGVENLLD